MADVPQPERFRRIAAAVDHLIEPDDELLLYRGEEGVEVVDYSSLALSRQHPQLYGRLLSMNAQMQASGVHALIGIIGIVVFWMGEQAGWWNDWLTPDIAERLNVWYVYVLLALLMFAVVGFVGSVKARGVYRSGRPDLFALIHAAGLDRDRLLVLIKEDNELESVIEQLKLDRDPPPTTTPEGHVV